MIKFLGLVFVTSVILEINGLVNSYSIKPVNGKVGKPGFFHIVDDLLDENGKHSKDLMKNKQVLICKNCTILIAAASNGSSADNRLSVGNNNAESDGLGYGSGVKSYGIPFPPYGEPSNNAGTKGAGADYNDEGASVPAYNDEGASYPAYNDASGAASNVTSNNASVNEAALNGVNTESYKNAATDTNNVASAYGEAAAPANAIGSYEVNGDNYTSDDD